MNFLPHYCSFSEEEDSPSASFFFAAALEAFGFFALLSPFSSAAPFAFRALGFLASVSAVFSTAGAGAAFAGFAFLGATSTTDKNKVIWLVRFRMILARPIALGCIRFMTGPPSTSALETQRSSTSPISFWDALATADFNTFSITLA